MLIKGCQAQKAHNMQGGQKFSCKSCRPLLTARCALQFGLQQSPMQEPCPYAFDMRWGGSQSPHALVGWFNRSRRPDRGAAWHCLAPRLDQAHAR